MAPTSSAIPGQRVCLDETNWPTGLLPQNWRPTKKASDYLRRQAAAEVAPVLLLSYDIPMALIVEEQEEDLISNEQPALVSWMCLDVERQHVDWEETSVGEIFADFVHLEY